MKEIVFLGVSSTGEFIFSEGYKAPTHAFASLAEAVERFGRAIKIESSSISSPRHHAGYNEGLLLRPYDPKTRTTDGAPRRLTPGETWEYGMGYIEGLLMSAELLADKPSEEMP